MPQVLLARLADLKSDLDRSGTETDAQLLRYLAAASSLAERAAGLKEGGLRRAVDRIEFPGAETFSGRRLHLDAREVESVSEIIQLYSTGTDADFATAVTDGDVLVENVDYAIDSRQLAVLERINSRWYRRDPRCIRVIYTAGLADPARIKVALATATWTEATQTLTQVGAFAGYAHTAGDKISIESGTPGSGVTPGTYLIASRTSDNAVVLDESISPTGEDLTGVTSLAPGASGVTDPPDELQAGVIRQAVLLSNTADTAGLEKIDFGDAGGSVSVRGMKPHPALVAAAQRYRRLI